MNLKEALQRDGTAGLDPASVTFRFSPHAEKPFTVFWDVTAIATCLVSRRVKVEWMELEGLQPWLQDGRISIDREHAMSEKVDLQIPILAIHFEDGSLPVDGWHRIYKATKYRRTRLPCLFLEGEEEHRFRYPQPLCDSLRAIADNPQYQLLEQIMERASRRGRSFFILGA